MKACIFNIYWYCVNVYKILSQKQLIVNEVHSLSHKRKDKPAHFSASVSLVLLLGSKSFKIKDEKKTSNSMLTLSKNKMRFSLVTLVRNNNVETFHD